jgi:hypothetical protein
MLLAHAFLALTTPAPEALLAVQPRKSVMLTVAKPVPEPHKLQLELVTAGDNLYRVTFVVQGQTGLEVRDCIVKELKRHHWDAEPARAEGVWVYGFKPVDGPTEPITGITITMFANNPRETPPVPGANWGGDVRVKIQIQLYPLGPGLEEKP